MGSVHFDSSLSDDERCARLYAGDVFMPSPTDGSRALVIFPAASIGAPDEDTLKVLRRLLTPSKFEKLFVEKRVFTPVGAFKDVAAALLDHDKAEEICDLLEKESAAQVRFS